MRVLIAALLLSISMPALAENIANCEVVLMETIKQEGLDGTAEVASFRPAADFIASIYDEESDVLREIDGMPIRAVMCKRRSVVPSESDFPIIATGTPFMISQNFDSTETGLTTIYFKDGEFRSSYKGPELSAKLDAEMEARLKAFNAKPHDLAEKEKAMQEKSESSDEEEILEDDVASEDELIAISKETPKTGNVASEDELIAISKDQGEAVSKESADSELEDTLKKKSTDKTDSKDDKPSESSEKDDAPAEDDMDPISPEELKEKE